MLPSWRDEIRAVLCPDRVILVRVARGFRRKVVAKQLVPCEAGQGGWQPAVDALRAALAQPRWSGAADATLVISNHFVRYRLVPWSAELADDDEERAWVARHFTDTYGEPAAPLEYQWSAQTPDGLCLASAVDRELIAGVNAAFAKSASRLRSIQPYFMYAFNRWRVSMSGARQWFVLGEPGQVCIGSVARGRWCSFRAGKLGAEWQAEMPVLLQREMLLAEAGGDGEVLVHFAGMAESALTHLTQPAARPLSPPPIAGYSPATDSAYAMAFSGAG